MSSVCNIDNLLLASAVISHPKELKALASEWHVTFEDGRTLLYVVTIIQGSFDNEFYNDRLYIQIDNCSIAKTTRQIQVLPKLKKHASFKRASQRAAFYKIAKKSFVFFEDTQKLSFKKISHNKSKWIERIATYLREKLEIEQNDTSESAPLIPEAGQARFSFQNGSSARRFSQNLADENGSSRNDLFHRLFCCCC